MLTNFFFVWMLFTKVAFFSPFMVEGESMMPTLHQQELFLIDRKVVDTGDNALHRGDIVVFSFDNSFYYVKRVIGLPGEYLKINQDGVWIRGSDGSYQHLDEFYLGGKKFNYGDERFFMVPEKQYFVLGDNRDHSKDSRFFSPPYVSLSQIYGKYIYP